MSLDLQQSVHEYLFGPCSETVLAEKACESDYWAKVEEFVMDNENVWLEKLSYKQREWLIKIKEGLLE